MSKRLADELCFYCPALATTQTSHQYAAQRGTTHNFWRDTCAEHMSLAQDAAVAWRKELERRIYALVPRTTSAKPESK